MRRRIFLEHVKENAILEENIYAINGSLLLSQGTKISTRIIERLKVMGYQKVTIYDERFKGLEINNHEALSEKTKIEALSTTKNILEHYQKSGEIVGVERLNNSVDSILDEILENKEATVDISSVQNYDLGTYTHSLSVTILSLYLAKRMGLNKNQLRNIGIGGLLHDLGKLNIPLKILNKPGGLTLQEREIVKKHPMDGFLKLRNNIPLLAAHVALQHHEKFDGSGYPRKLKKDQIHMFGRITAIADVYDAITTDRPYRPGIKSDKAIKFILSRSGSHFDPEVLHHFLSIISPYPNGSIVKLNNGDKAIVKEQNQGFPLEPVVFVFEKSDVLLSEYEKNDLKFETDVTVKEVSENEN